jgi:acetyl esterase/lipase
MRTVQSFSLLMGLCLAVSTGMNNERPSLAAGPDPILLWPDGAPGAVGTEAADRPEIRIYPADESNSNGACVVVCPGGGYGALAMDHEGHQIARWYNTIGVSAVVLKYRLGRRYRHPAPLQDVQRAVRYTRAHADELKIDPDRVGVMGFSAGGHLASTISTHFDAGHPDSSDPVERESCRPDFAVLAYPVISFTADFAHRGSARNLLGDDPDPELLKSLSNETQVTAETPPTFLFHTGEDKGVPVQNSLAYYQALVEHDVPAELHVYQKGPHGVGLGVGDPVLYTWKERLADWLQTNGFLADVERFPVTGAVEVDGTPLERGTITFLPQDSKQAPIPWARVSRGEFEVADGIGVGTYTVIIRDLGSVQPFPTLDDAVIVSPGGVERPQLIARVEDVGENHFVFSLDGE